MQKFTLDQYDLRDHKSVKQMQGMLKRQWQHCFPLTEQQRQREKKKIKVKETATKTTTTATAIKKMHFKLAGSI